MPPTLHRISSQATRSRLKFKQERHRPATQCVATTRFNNNKPTATSLSSVHFAIVVTVALLSTTFASVYLLKLTSCQTLETTHPTATATINLDSQQQQPTRQPNSRLWTTRRSKPVAAINVGARSQQQAKKRKITTNSDLSARNQEAGVSDFIAQRVSVTARISHLRVPINSSCLLKCLISTPLSTSRFKDQSLAVHWSRYVYASSSYEPLTTNASNNSTDLDLASFQSRARQETSFVSDLLIEATLAITNVSQQDNGTYFCAVADKYAEYAQAQIDLTILSKPIIAIDRVVASKDSRNARLYYFIQSDGNSPIRKTILMIRNDTAIASNQANGRGNSGNIVGRVALVGIVSGSSSSTQSDSSSTFSPDYNPAVDTGQWQRFDIPGEGNIENNLASHSQSQTNFSSSDADVTSLVATNLANLSDEKKTSSNPDQYSSQHTTVATKTVAHQAKKQRVLSLTNLLPAVSYKLKLAVVNDFGQSNWSELTAVLANETPLQIGEVLLLWRTNDSLAFGWRRSHLDRSKTVRYELQLLDLNRTLAVDAHKNATDFNSASASNTQQVQKTNFMYVFVNLNPGTDYHFHVRACARSGCSPFSFPKLAASTLDGEPDEPLDVELACSSNLEQVNTDDSNIIINRRLSNSDVTTSSKLTVSWLPPRNARGMLTNYTVNMIRSATFLNLQGEYQTERGGENAEAIFETRDNITLSLDSTATTNNQNFIHRLLVPNSNVSVTVCAANRAYRCGKLSSLKTCSLPPQLPILPPSGSNNSKFELQHSDDTQIDKGGSLVLNVPNISQRNGTIDCVQVILVRLASVALTASTASDGDELLMRALPNDPSKLELGARVYTSNTNNSQQPALAVFAYIAEEFEPSRRGASAFGKRIKLGDGRQQLCHSLSLRVPTAALGGAKRIVFDAQLRANCYYTGFARFVIVETEQVASSIIIGNTDYFAPIKTGTRVIEIGLSGNIGNQGAASRGAESNDQTVNDAVDESGFVGTVSSFSEATASAVGSLLDTWQRVTDHVIQMPQLRELSSFVTSSSPSAQLFQVALVVMLATLFTIAVIFVFCFICKYMWILMCCMCCCRPFKRKDSNKSKEQKKKKNQQHQATKENTSQDRKLLLASDSDPKMFQESNYGSKINGANNTNISKLQESIDDGNGLMQLPTELNECPIHTTPQKQMQLFDYSQQQQVADKFELRNCRTMRRSNVQEHEHNNASARQQTQQTNIDMMQSNFKSPTIRNNIDSKHMTLSQQQGHVLAFARKFAKPVPIEMLAPVFECRQSAGWMRDEFEALPQPQIGTPIVSKMRLRSYVLSRRPLTNDATGRQPALSAFIGGINDEYDASEVALAPVNVVQQQQQVQRRYICAKSPLDADEVFDFWRLLLEKKVDVIVMLTPNEDAQTGQVRCASYWPTSEDEQLAIIAPRTDSSAAAAAAAALQASLGGTSNVSADESPPLPAIFKVRMEVLGREAKHNSFSVRKLTLLVQAARLHPNNNDKQQQFQDSVDTTTADEDDDAKLTIEERDIKLFQLHAWNSASAAAQQRLVSFVEFVATNTAKDGGTSPILVHCANGIGRSGVFVALSNLIDELSELTQLQQDIANQGEQIAGETVSNEMRLKFGSAKISIFQLVAQMRKCRALIVSPQRNYELIYRLAANYISAKSIQLQQQQQQQQQIQLPHQQ